MTECFNSDDPSIDWTLRHGRSAVLSVALKDAPSEVYRPQWRDRRHRVLLSYLTADRVPIVSYPISAMGFLFKYLDGGPINLPLPLAQPFGKTLNHASNEVKQLLAQSSQYLGRHVGLYSTGRFPQGSDPSVHQRDEREEHGRAVWLRW